MIKVDVQDAEVVAALDSLTKQLGNMEPVYDTIGSNITENIRLGLSEGETPWGQPFEPLKNQRPSNLDGRESDKPLNDTRLNIYKKVTHNPSANGVEVGLLEDSPIGITHQFGSLKKNIPARPFMPINPTGEVDMPDDWKNEIMDIVQRHIDKAI